MFFLKSKTSNKTLVYKKTNIYSSKDKAEIFNLIFNKQFSNSKISFDDLYNSIFVPKTKNFSYTNCS